MNAISGLADIQALERIALTEHNLPCSTYSALQRTAKRTPEAAALTFFYEVDAYQRTWSWNYGQLLTQITRAANVFYELGVRAGDVVAFVLPNLPETHFCIWGGEAAGIVMPLNPLLEGAQIAELLRAANAKVLVTLAPTPGHDTWERLAPHINQLTSIEKIVWVSCVPYLAGPAGATAQQQADDQAERFADARLLRDLRALMAQQPGDRLLNERQIQAHDHSSYFCTGGTTGLPKIAVRTHGSEVANAWSLAAVLGSHSTPKNLFCGLPLFHVNAQLVTGLMPWLLGDHVVLGTPLGYRSAGLVTAFWRIVEHFGIHFFSGVPTVYAALLQQPVENADISSLGYVLCGAAPMPVELFRAFEQATGVRILEGYGLTEGACVSAVNPPQGERRVGSIGLRLPYQQMRALLLDESGRYVADAPRDEVGVIAIQGPNLFAGYLDENHNRGAWIDVGGTRWLNTGDLGRQDEDGYFWLTGRKKELIIRSGHNIDPKQIEEALQAHPAVALVAAVGSPDAYAGEVPVAYVQLVNGAHADSDELLAYAAQRIHERAAVPKRIEILPVLPVTAVGKLFKPALQQREIERAVRHEGESVGLQLDVVIVHDPRRGFVAQIRGGQGERISSALGRYTFAVEYLP